MCEDPRVFLKISLSLCERLQQHGQLSQTELQDQRLKAWTRVLEVDDYFLYLDGLEKFMDIITNCWYIDCPTKAPVGKYLSRNIIACKGSCLFILC